MATYCLPGNLPSQREPQTKKRKCSSIKPELSPDARSSAADILKKASSLLASPVIGVPATDVENLYETLAPKAQKQQQQ